jgi:hypothetical protein
MWNILLTKSRGLNPPTLGGLLLGWGQIPVLITEFSILNSQFSINFKRSIYCLLSLVLTVTIATSVMANAPQPPSLYWFKFDVPAQLQGVQIAQCLGKSCERTELLKQYGTCDRSSCIKSLPKLTYPKPLSIDCADNLCLVALSPFYNKKELDPQQLRFIAQSADRVFESKIFPLGDRHLQSDRFTVKAIDKTLEISSAPAEQITQSSLFKDLASFFLLLTLVIELGIWASYLRWRKVESNEIRLTIIWLTFIHFFSFPIVWFSFPGLEQFAEDSTRYGGLMWLGFAVLYGIILSLHSIRAKQPASKIVVGGSIAYWLGAAVVTLIFTGLLGYGSPVPSAAGLSEPLAILASELFVVGYEAWLIQRLRRDTLAWKTALGVSLAANTASCLFGLALTLLPN